MRKVTVFSVLLSLLVLVVLDVLKLNAAWGQGTFVALGTDYYQTQPGTSFDFGEFGHPEIGVVNFTGVPIGPGLTDTIVQRKADAEIGFGPALIQIVDLHLKSTAPVNIGGSFFDVFVTLDPANLSKDTGTVTVHGNLAGGTFDSSLNEFLRAHFAPLGGGSIPDVFFSTVLSQTGASWSPTPPPGTLLIPGVDEGIGDQGANFHVSGLDDDEVDFFPSLFKVCDSTGGLCHAVAPTRVVAEVAEPASLLLLGTALAGLFGAAGRPRRAKCTVAGMTG